MSNSARTDGLSHQLLLSVAEHLKIPFAQLARQAELGLLTGKPDLGSMQTVADGALRLIDAYTLGVRLASDSETLHEEAVSVSAILYDAGHQLDAMAKSYGVGLELHVAGRFAPVIAHKEGLQAALVSLGAALIEALPASEGSQTTLLLSTHKGRYGIVTGMYAKHPLISQKALEAGRLQQGTAKQSMPGASHATGASLFIADALLRAMSLPLAVSRHRSLYGLATTLQTSNQMQLV